MLTTLAQACRQSGLIVIELDDWRTRKSNGGEDFQGVLVHHTGSYDTIGDASSDLAYAKWMTLTGRSDLPPPLCNLALSAEGVVYVCAAGNANHAGRARASGPMPAAPDGGRIYIGIEAMNSGSQGWDTRGRDAAGVEITQYEAYVRLCAALCKHYGWPASHVRAHKETSVTGKWDPGMLDMTKFRLDIAAETLREDDQMTPEQEALLRENLRINLQTLQELRAFRLGKAKSDKKVKDYLREIIKQGKGDATKAQVQQIYDLIESQDEE